MKVATERLVLFSSECFRCIMTIGTFTDNCQTWAYFCRHVFSGQFSSEYLALLSISSYVGRDLESLFFVNRDIIERFVNEKAELSDWLSKNRYFYNIDALSLMVWFLDWLRVL